MVVPADWKELELSRVAEIGPGINKALSEMGTGSLYVTVEDIYSGSSLDIRRLGRIRISRSEIERFSLQVGDLVLGKSSVKRDGIGYPNLFLGCAEPVVPSGFTYRVRPDKKVLSSTFLLQYLRSRPGRKWVIDNSQSSALTNINSSIINRYPVIVPPLKEQEAIAEALSDADAAIESLDALIAKKRDVKQATMQQLLTGRTRLPGFDADWKEVRLGDIAEIISGGTPSTAIGSYWGGDIPWCTPTDITSCKSNYLFETERKITPAGLAGSAASLLPPGSLLLCTRATVGEVRIAGRAIATNQGFKSLVVNSQANSKFVYFVLQTLRPAMIEKSSGSTFLELGKNDLSNIVALMPPLKEQELIAEALTVMDDELEALTEQVSKLRMVKEGMMQDLLTGKVRLV